MGSFIVRYVLEIVFPFLFYCSTPSYCLIFPQYLLYWVAFVTITSIYVMAPKLRSILTDSVPLCIYMRECLHDQMRCLTQMTAPCPQTVCFSINPLSTKCKYSPVAVHHPRVIILCLWFNKCVPSLDLCLTEGPSTRMLAHGSLKCLHLFLRFQQLRNCSRRLNPSPYHTVCCALD